MRSGRTVDHLHGVLSKRAMRFRLVPLNAQASAPAGGGNAGWIVLHAELEGLKPPVRRRLRVPAKSEVSHHLQMLHVVLQVALDFEDAHLHAFDTLDGRGHVKQTYRTPPPEFSSGWIRTDEREPTSLDLPLAKAFPRIGSKVRYHYDFGDGWTFLLTRVKPEPAEAPGSPHAARGFACFAGELRRPARRLRRRPWLLGPAARPRAPEDLRARRRAHRVGKDAGPRGVRPGRRQPGAAQAEPHGGASAAGSTRGPWPGIGKIIDSPRFHGRPPPPSGVLRLTPLLLLFAACAPAASRF